MMLLEIQKERTFWDNYTYQSSKRTMRRVLYFSSPNGETRALDWEEAADEYYRALFAYCFRMLGNREDAEDATQEVFLRAYAVSERRVKNSNIAAWFYTIARNVCVDRLRWWKRWTKKLSRGAIEMELRESGILSKEKRADDVLTFLQGPIDSLPLRQREVFLLRFLHEFSTAETAQILEITEGTVKSTLQKARLKLASIVKEVELEATKEDVPSLHVSKESKRH